MTWIPCQARYDRENSMMEASHPVEKRDPGKNKYRPLLLCLLYFVFCTSRILQHAFPVSADMIDILLYLIFELVE